MRSVKDIGVIGIMGLLVIAPVMGCSAKAKPALPADSAQAAKTAAGEADVTPMPTVPPATPTPEETATPAPPARSGAEAKAKKGQPVGPVISFFGAARADGSHGEPVSVDAKGVATYRSSAGSGFILVVEAKPGESGAEVGRRVFSYQADDPTLRPDLEIQSNRDLGNGTPAVCDRRRPNIGGIPGIRPMSFAETQKVSDAINDFGCRFEIFNESESACTLDAHGDFAFINKDSTMQFCMMVARAYQFPVGETVLSVRVRDSEGNPGPVKQMRIVRPATPDKPKPGAK